MPSCRNCKSRITKFDKDICPVCGCKNPLDGVTSETVEITSQIDTNNPQFRKYRPTLRSVIFLLFALIGFTGAGFFYQKCTRKGIFWLVINIVIFAVGGSLAAFLSPLGILWGYLVFLFSIYAFNILVGLFYLLKDDLKDGNGEFIK